MLRTAFLQANQAWAVVCPSGDICGISWANRRLFSSKKELKQALLDCSLGLDGNRVVALD